jgi:hypothetical protein
MPEAQTPLRSRSAAGTSGSRAWLGATDTITESTWVVPLASGLTTHSPSISTDGKVTTVWLKSGNAGGVYSATNHIKTAAGREDGCSLRVTIVDR